MADRTLDGLPEGLGKVVIYAPRGLTDTGRIHQFQTRTVAKLAEAAVRFRDELNNSMYAAIAGAYTEGEDNEGHLLLNTTKARLGYTGRDRVEVALSTGAPHARFLTAAVDGGTPGTEREILPTRKYLKFFWKSPPAEVGPPGVYKFGHVLWRPHNVPAGEDVIGAVISYYTERFQSDMLSVHNTALVEYVAAGQDDMVQVA